MFDAFEVVGGISTCENNMSVALWGDVRSEGCNIPVVASSDMHNLTNDTNFPYKFTICFAKSTSEADILDAVRDGMCVAVEKEGYEYDATYRAYGNLRFVIFAQFLLNNYFPALQRICQGEGVAMRSYAMGLCDKSLIEAQVEQTEKFKDVFFGRKAPTLPTPEILDFENRWRERHLNGPKTWGSSLLSGKITRQI